LVQKWGIIDYCELQATPLLCPHRHRHPTHPSF
jgi:hypothetical protein